MDDTIATIEESRVSSLTSITNTADEHKSALIQLNGDAKKLLDSLTATKSIQQESMKEVNGLITTLHHKITDEYEDYEENLMEQLDQYKEKYRSWIKTVQKGAPPIEILSDIKKEKAELEFERKHLKAERLLWKKKEEEIDTLMTELRTLKEDIKAPQSPPNIHTPPRTNIEYNIPHHSTTVLDEDGCLPTDKPIIYNDGTNKFIGHIMPTKPEYNNGNYYYDIFSVGGLEMRHCSDKHINIYQDNMEHFTTSPYRSAPPQESNDRPYHKTPYNSSRNTERKLNHNEFIYPIGTEPRTVWSQSLVKYGKQWHLQISDREGLITFYNTLHNMLSEYNIFIKPYEQITRSEGLELINVENCNNHESAIKAMSKAIFTYIDQSKDTIFKLYDKPLHAIDAFRPSFDGLGFLKHVMADRHPALKELTDVTTDLNLAPTYDKYRTIYEFINAYINWVQDEQLQNRQYSNKDKIDWVIGHLDRERWEPAINAVESIKADIYADEDKPKPWPKKLELTPKLAIWLVERLPKDQRTGLHNDIDDNSSITPGIINRTYGKNNNADNGYRKDWKDKNDWKSQGRPQQKVKWKPNSSSKDTKFNWAKILKYEKIPGARCPGCGGINHNVYKTGCPKLAQFAICKEFYDKTPKEQLQPVKDSYDSYMSELRHKRMRQSRNETKRTLNKLKDYYDDEEMNNLSESFYEVYQRDFPDATINTNPFNDLELEDEPEDMDDDHSVEDM